MRTVEERSSGKLRCTIEGTDLVEALSAGALTREALSGILLLSQQRSPERVDVARAHHKTYVALAEHSLQDPLGFGEARQPVNRLSPRSVHRGLGEQQSTDPGWSSASSRAG